MTETMQAEHSKRQLIKGWFALSRLPFHIVGILPFLLGTILACRIAKAFNPEVFFLGICGVILIMLSTYHSGEYFDRKEDALSAVSHKNPFAGGSRAIPVGGMPHFIPLWTGVVSLLAAAAIGVILQFAYRTGPWTLVLGCLGALPGFFYSTEPVRLVKRGVGELFIGFCYGWLPVAAAYYIQTGTIEPVIHWIGLPIGFSIFNVILINEFPDYEADMATGKKNLLYRIGKARGKALYVALALLTCLTMALSPLWGVPFRVIFFFIPFGLIALFIVRAMLRNLHDDPAKLELLCGLTIAVNMGTSLSYIMAYI
ncbi:MAG: prenyltransferase [Syntrophales bacterium]|nr:prenyltransferase [Syntrophales bacterium]